MNLHLVEIPRNVATDAHAVPPMDQAGWHLSANLIVPENISIRPLPPRSPEPGRKLVAIRQGQLWISRGASCLSARANGLILQSVKHNENWYEISFGHAEIKDGGRSFSSF
jgi:hypothetical protein